MRKPQPVATSLPSLPSLKGGGRTLHPALATRAQAVKFAHAHLSTHLPGFKNLPSPARFAAVQAHVRKMGGR